MTVEDVKEKARHRIDESERVVLDLAGSPVGPRAWRVDSFADAERRQAKKQKVSESD